MPNLFVAFPNSIPTVQSSAPAPVAFPPGPDFDFELKDFKRDGNGHILWCDGWTNWRNWCIKALMTEQASYAIYPRWHGIYLRSALRRRVRALQADDVQTRVGYTLTRTPRTGRVDDFSFEWWSRGLYVECTPHPVQGDPFKLRHNFPAAAA